MKALESQWKGRKKDLAAEKINQLLQERILENTKPNKWREKEG